jgi:ribulose 1,5-bisphosphate synthetase/thiazole synthase
MESDSGMNDALKFRYESILFPGRRAMPSSVASMIVSNSQQAATDVTEPPIVIIGNGVTGMHAARELLRRKPTQPLVIFGVEP